MSNKTPYTGYNLYFIIPFIVWIIAGGVLFVSEDQGTIFSFVNGHYDNIANWVMYYATWLGEGIVITGILLLLLLIVPSFRNWWYFLCALLCGSVPALVSQWIKHIHNYPRPMDYFHKAAWIHMEPNWPVLMKNSFPSGHTTGAFSLFCLLAMLLPKKYQLWGLIFFFMALLVAYSRMYLAAHFFRDVYAGSIIGTTVTILIFTLMRHYKPKFFNNSKYTTANT